MRACREVLRLPQRGAEGLDFLEHDIAVGHVEHGKLSWNSFEPKRNVRFALRVQLVPAAWNFVLECDEIDAGRLRPAAGGEQNRGPM